ncbi:MAG: hypothetical protein QNK32_00055 [Porticoccus sp.]|nr:hypothetical protein [Porticoccus sp.]
MNSQRIISAFVLMLMISFTSNAEKVYERTNSQGVEEFSDQGSPDAKVIDIKPNVVEVVQPEPGEPRHESAKPASREQGSVRVVDEGVEDEGNNSNYYDDDVRRRENRVRREHRETHQSRPQHKGAARGGGGHR